MKNTRVLKLMILYMLLFILAGLMGCAPATHSSSPTAANSPTVTPSETPTLEITPSVTDLPTLAKSEAQAELSQLLASNTCEFPCLWDITPGITRLNEVKNLNRFSIFSGGAGVFSEKGGLLFLRIPQPNETLLNLSIEADIVDGVVDQTSFGTQMVQKVGNGYEWVTDDPLYAQVTKGFSLSRVLSEYGEPAEVYISTLKIVPLMGDPWDFDILLLYPKKHFVARYTAFAKYYIQDGDIVACPSLAFSSFWLWNPSKEVSTQEVMARYHFNEGKPIDVATTMSIKTFYSTFRESDNQQCIRTPQEMWLSP
jgi:hypothetical protein